MSTPSAAPIERTPAAPADISRRRDEHVLTLPFECLKSLPEGLAEVRVWRDPLLDCQQVGKRIDLHGISDDSLPEAATLQSVRHDNIVPILAAARVTGYAPPMDVVELITPYFKRGSITDALLRGETFRAREAVAITQATLRGLSHLHEVHGICHRDMKSGNVLLCEENVARVADLGVAGRFDTAGIATAVNNPTLYSSPEFGDTARLTRSSDIFGVGLLLRELLGGAFPYVDYPKTHVLRQLTRGQSIIRAADLEMPIWTSASLLRVYKKAIRRGPPRRFQTAREMDDALSRAIAVDWVEIDAGHRWEAPFINSPGTHVAVESTPKKRSKEARMTTLVNRGRGWRRHGQAVDVPGLYVPEARKVFNQASFVAAAR